MTSKFRNEVKSSGVSNDAELLHLLESATLPVLVLASTDECPPCIFIKPIIRKLALEFSDWLIVAEVTIVTAPAFLAHHGVDAFPTLLLLSANTLVARDVGYTDAEQVRNFVVRFTGSGKDVALTAGEVDFQRMTAEAMERVGTIMAEANADLVPHMEAIMPEIARYEQRMKQDIASGLMTEPEAKIRHRANVLQLYRPFQDKVAALQAAQSKALCFYENHMEAGLDRYVAATRKAAAMQLICEADGRACKVVLS